MHLRTNPVRRSTSRFRRAMERLEERHLLAITIANVPAENVGPTSATIGLEIVDDGGVTPNAAIYWGEANGGTDTRNWQNRIRLGDLSVGTYTTELTDLEIGTQYFYRGYGFSILAGGETWATESATFLTTPPLAPTVMADEPGRVGATSIRVSGAIQDSGGQVPHVSVYFGDNDGEDDSEAWDSSLELGEFDATFETQLSRLTTNTKYFYRFAAQNNGGIGWSETVSFQTPNAAPLQISEISAAGGTDFATRVRGSAENDFGGDPVEYDWIEIENTTAQPIDISGYFLTDRKDTPQKWEVPFGTVVPAFDVMTVYASGFDVSDPALDERGRLHAGFRLSSGGEYLGLFDRNTDVVHELDPFPAMYPGSTYGTFGVEQNFFGVPTPDQANLSGEQNVAPPPTVSLRARTFTDTLHVEFSTTLDGGVIRYTTDGEVPSAESLLYEGPITVLESTEFRVRTFGTGHVPSEIVAESYVKLDAAVTGYTSDLPIFVIDNFGKRRPSKARHVPFQMMLFDVDPGTGTSSIDAAPDLHVRIGLKVRGQSSAGDPKTPYRFEVRNQYDEDFDVSLLGLPEDSDWILHGPWSDRTLVHNSLAYEIADDIGLDAPRTRFVELFRNQRDGPIEEDDFLGLYLLVENIKRGDNRVDIPTLDAGDIKEPEITGGYIVRFEQNVSEARDRLRGWQHLELLDGQKYTAEQKDWITNYISEVDAAIENAGSSRHYENFVDVDSFVDMLLISELGRDQDAYVRSHYYYKDRGGKLVSGPIWDFNLIWNRGCCFDNRNVRGWQFDQDRPGQPNGWNKGQHNWNGDLMDSPAFAQKVIDRWAELRKDENPFSFASLVARIDRHVAEIRSAVDRNYQRWPNQLTSSSGFGGPRFPTHQEHIDDMKDWIRRRLDWIDDQFQTAPEITIANATATLTTNAGEVYYTINGTDPFDSNTGEPSAAAILYQSPIAIDADTIIVARSRDLTVAPRRTEMILTQWSSPASSATGFSGDVNSDGIVNVNDIDDLCGEIDSGTEASEAFDLNRDGVLDQNDVDELVFNRLKTTYGDVDLDGAFDSNDLVLLFQSRQYEDLFDDNSSWSSGDWNCDRDFTSRDFVLAFMAGRYAGEAPMAVRRSDVAAARSANTEFPWTSENRIKREEKMTAVAIDPGRERILD